MTPNAHSNGPENISDWSHVKETINMLYLAVCQIETTLNDSNESIDTLTTSFTQLANHTGEVSQQIQNLTEVQQIQDFKEDITSTANEMQTNIVASVQAFQFYDRVCQRLDHVARSLEQVSQVMEDQDKVFSPAAWQSIQEKIKSSYTMEAERIMFEFIMRGGTVKDALEIYRHEFDKDTNDHNDDDDEIELF